MDYSQTNAALGGRWEMFLKHLKKNQLCFPSISNPFTQIGVYKPVDDRGIMQKKKNASNKSRINKLEDQLNYLE